MDAAVALPGKHSRGSCSTMSYRFQAVVSVMPARSVGRGQRGELLLLFLVRELISLYQPCSESSPGEIGLSD